MAASLDTVPGLVQPVYQPAYCQVQSSNYTQPQFRFVFDIYKNGVNVERVRMLPKPGTNIAIFSPMRVLESYLSYDLSVYNYNAVGQTNCMLQYQVQVGEEYGPTTAAPVVYANQTRYSGMTFNGNVQYKDYYWGWAGAKWATYYMKYPISSSGKFLTNAPYTQKVQDVDKGTISAFNFMTSDVSDAAILRVNGLEIVTYQRSGGTTYTYANFYYNTGTTIAEKLVHFPAGPDNINNISGGLLISGATTNIIDGDRDYKYTLRLWNIIPGATIMTSTLNVPVSEYKEFEIQDCSKYDNVRLMFLNRLGAFDYFNFNKVSRSAQNTERTTFKKNLPITYYYGTSVYDRETTVLNSLVNKTVTVNSDWIDDDTSTWLEELWSSPEVYEKQLDAYGNTVWVPVVITTTTQEVKKRINDQIYNYTLEYTYSTATNVQRG